MYEADDPRSAMSTGSAGGTEQGMGAFGQSTYARFYAEPPQESGKAAKTWYTRGQNFVVCYSEVEDGAVFERSGQVDEYVLLIHDPDVSATVEAGGETRPVGGYSITMVPPGDSKVTVNGSGVIVRLITTQNRDIAAKVSNPEKYVGPHPHVPELEPWPTPEDGFRIRSYSLDVPDEPGRFGKIFRCTTFMVNVFPAQGPRDLGWHVQLAVEGERLPGLLDQLLKTGVDIVIDHFGHPDPADPLNCHGFQALLAAVDTGRCWVKLSGGFRLPGTAAWRDDPDGDLESLAATVAASLIEKVGTDRLLWGSDAPFVGYEDRVSYDRVLDSFRRWVPDPARRAEISRTAMDLYFL